MPRATIPTTTSRTRRRRRRRSTNSTPCSRAAWSVPSLPCGSGIGAFPDRNTIPSPSCSPTTCRRRSAVPDTVRSPRSRRSPGATRRRPWFCSPAWLCSSALAWRSAALLPADDHAIAFLAAAVLLLVLPRLLALLPQPPLFLVAHDARRRSAHPHQSRPRYRRRMRALAPRRRQRAGAHVLGEPEELRQVLRRHALELV